MSAQWSLTSSLRMHLADRGIRVAGLHVGYTDTDMVQAVDAPKSHLPTSRASPWTVSPPVPTRSSPTTPPARRRPPCPGGVRARYPQLP
ncbi:hypothetical protein [Streptomyces sp. NPDC002324]